MWVARNDYGTDTAYIATLNMPDKNTVERGGQTGIYWSDPELTYVKVLKTGLFEQAEGIKLEPGEGPIRFMLSRVEVVSKEDDNEDVHLQDV